MNPAMRVHYEKRAAEYDDWWRGTGLFATRSRPGWHEDVEALRGGAARAGAGADSVYQRWFTASGLAAEIGGEVLHDGPWFVVARSSSPRS